MTSSAHPDIKKYQNQQLFKKFNIEEIPLVQHLDIFRNDDQNLELPFLINFIQVASHK